MLLDHRSAVARYVENGQCGCRCVQLGQLLARRRFIRMQAIVISDIGGRADQLGLRDCPVPAPGGDTTQRVLPPETREEHPSQRIAHPRRRMSHTRRPDPPHRQGPGSVVGTHPICCALSAPYRAAWAPQVPLRYTLRSRRPASHIEGKICVSSRSPCGTPDTRICAPILLRFIPNERSLGFAPLASTIKNGGGARCGRRGRVTSAWQSHSLRRVESSCDGSFGSAQLAPTWQLK